MVALRHGPSSMLSLVKWPQCVSSVPLGCLFPRFTLLVGQRCEDGIYEIHEAQRCVAGAEGTGYRFGLASTCSARVSPDAESFSRWWKPLLYQRPGMEGNRSSTWTGDHVRHSLPFLLLNFLELIDTIDKNTEALLVAAARSRKELAYLEQFTYYRSSVKEGRLMGTRSSHRRTTSRVQQAPSRCVVGPCVHVHLLPTKPVLHGRVRLRCSRLC